jgi:hypothetical protein
VLVAQLGDHPDGANAGVLGESVWDDLQSLKRIGRIKKNAECSSDPLEIIMMKCPRNIKVSVCSRMEQHD